MVNLYFNPKDLQPSLPQKPRAFGFTDLNTGAYYEIANNGQRIFFVYDSPACLVPLGHSSKEDYIKSSYKDAIIITGPYDPIFIQGLVDSARGPMDAGTLIVDESTQMLYPNRNYQGVAPISNMVIRRKLGDGKVILLQNHMYYLDDQIDAYLLSVDQVNSTVLEDVADLRNPRLGLEQVLKGNVLIGDGDELLLNLKYFPKENISMRVLVRGTDLNKGLPVMSQVSGLDLIRMGKDPKIFAEINDSTLEQMILLELSRGGAEKFFWSPDVLSREHNQLRYWEAQFGLEQVLWRKFINLELYNPDHGKPSEPIEREKARFDGDGKFVGVRLQVKYLF